MRVVTHPSELGSACFWQQNLTLLTDSFLPDLRQGIDGESPAKDQEQTLLIKPGMSPAFPLHNAWLIQVTPHDAGMVWSPDLA